MLSNRLTSRNLRSLKHALIPAYLGLSLGLSGCGFHAGPYLPPATVSITNPGSFSVTTSEPTYDVRIGHRRQDFDTCTAYTINGLPQELTEYTQDPDDFEFTVDLQHGENLIGAYCTFADGSYVRSHHNHRKIIRE